MLFAIVSDIHANLEALTAVMADMPDYASLLHLGDAVGYGAKPNEVLDLLGSTRGVMGNHDCAALGDPDILATFNPSAKRSAEWTKSVLTPSSVSYLRALPYVATIADDDEFPFTVAHGSPFEPFEFHYVLSSHEAVRAMSSFSTQVCFIGHSHFPESFAKEGGAATVVREKHGIQDRLVYDEDKNDFVEVVTDSLVIRDGVQYVVNVGSVGQPRDGDPRASYALFDTTARTITWRRVAYDVAGASASIVAAGLPTRNSERLVTGS